MCVFDQVALSNLFPWVFFFFWRVFFLLVFNLDDSCVEKSCSLLITWHFGHERHHQKSRDQVCVCVCER